MGAGQVVLLGTGAVYGVALAWLLRGVRRGRRAASPAASTDKAGSRPSVSVVVAARDEAAHIDACLESLTRQEYPGTWEIVVVDDRSRDDTAARARRHAAADPRVSVVSAPDPPGFRCPKKSALACGVARASGELLLFTDADCRPGPGWIGSTVACFAPDVGLVAGYARPDPGGSLLQRLLALDNLAVGALAAGALAQGVVLACTGRNLAYRRAVYEQLGGYAPIGHLIGGDDVYFARRLATLTCWRSTYNRDPAAVVACSAPPRGWREALHQKLRHAGKAGHYRGPALLLGVSVYVFHLLLGWTLLRAAAGAADAVGLAVWLAKAGLDTALLGAMAGAKELRLLPLVPLLELLYIPYVLLFTVAGRLGWFRWKE